MNFFEKILYFLQKEMERPSSYGFYHFFCLFIMLLIIIILFKKKNYTEKNLKIVLATYAIGAFILELLKQIVWSFNFDPSLNLVTWDYQWYAFPYQLCSTPIYICLICLFLKKGKLRDNLFAYLAFFTILGSLSTAIYPESCFVRTILINIHTMYLHLGSLIVSVYLIMSKEVELSKKSFFNGYLVFAITAVIALIMNITFYNLNIINGETFNMFYISPYFISSLTVFDVIQSHTPYLVFLFLYFFAILSGGYLIFLMCKLTRYIYKKCLHVKS